MKKVYLVLIAMICLKIMTNAQSEDKSLKILDKLKSDGYTISTDQVVYLKQREFGSHTTYFYEGRKYIIICFSDDTNVLNLEVHLERMNGRIDNINAIDHGEIAMLFFKPKKSSKLNVVATNILSLTPSVVSECRIIAAFKK